MTASDIRVQTWTETLRLPCFTTVTEPLAKLLADTEQFRRPPLPFQSKHLPALKRDVMFVLQRPADKSRTGLLVLWPEQKCCVYISGDPPSQRRPTPRVALLRLRVDPQFLTEGLTIFAATLTSQRLWIEDLLTWKGRPVGAEEPFSARWLRIAQWLEHYCILDSRLLGGLGVELAPWRPMDRIEPEGIWDIIGESGGPRRYLWIANTRGSTLSTPRLTPLSPPQRPEVSAPKLEMETLHLDTDGGGPVIAIATRQSGPDQWALTSADGVSQGRALIRKLDVSAVLRSHKSTTVRVEVTWQSDFSKWEIRSLSSGHASHSSAFVHT